ncbi:hypothetical protein [Streptomyces otsuchiensis]|uniref:hypothetical protein n=1 Tax=Streptomyces otsuchiensis TaxID=2681388 RepID=UPI001031A0F6|nr:hypothetical protein [Streptomyces otsuchiensis]
MEISAPGRELAAFTVELRALTAELDPGADWYAAFARRVPTDLETWLSGLDLPPWDVVADLVQDLVAVRGPLAAREREVRLRDRYAAAACAQDARPTARADLARRAGLVEHAERESFERGHRLAVAERSARLAGHQQEAARLAALRMWAEDDGARHRSRLAEFHARLAALAARAGPSPTVPEQRDGSASPPVPTAPARGARFADTASAAPPPDIRPERAARPRGARFAGLDADTGGRQPSAPPRPSPHSEEDRKAATAFIARMLRLRTAGSGGAVHATLCEAVNGPPERLPLVVEAMERAGMGTEITTLLWEAAALPPGPMAGIARALADAGRGSQCGQLLRQGAARPSSEAGTIAAELVSAGRTGEAVTLLTALVRARRAADAVGAARAAPEVVPHLLDAARRVSPAHHHAITTELRRAGVA